MTSNIDPQGSLYFWLQPGATRFHLDARDRVVDEDGAVRVAAGVSTLTHLGTRHQLAMFPTINLVECKFELLSVKNDHVIYLLKFELRFHARRVGFFSLEKKWRQIGAIVCGEIIYLRVGLTGMDEKALYLATQLCA